MPNLRSVSRAGSTLLAQGLASITNFAAAALALDASDGDLSAFGKFAIAFQLCQVVIAIGEGSAANSVLIHTAKDSENTAVADVRDGAASAALAIGAALGAPMALAGLAIGGDLGRLLMLAGIGSPGLVAQYTLRAGRFARNDPAGVLRADAIWLAVLLAGAAGAWLDGWDPTVDGYLTLWLIGAAISGLPVIVVGLGRGRRHLATFVAVTGPQAVRFGLESFLARSVFVVELLAAAVIVGDDASGLLAAAALVFSPMSVVHTSVVAVVVPSQIRSGGIHVPEPNVPLLVFGGVGAITTAWAAALLLFNESAWAFGPFDLDGNELGLALFIAVYLRFMGLAFWRGPLVGLRVADAAGESLLARAIGVSTQWILIVVGLLVASTTGGAYGLAIATWVGAMAAWYQYVGVRTAARGAA